MTWIDDDALFLYAILIGAGGRAPLARGRMEALLEHRTRWPTPRDLERPGRMVRRWWKAGLIDMMLREARTGHYRRIAGALTYWAERGLDVASPALKREDLLAVPGVGPVAVDLFMKHRTGELER